ncbi:MAG: hypothetical protein WCD18_26055 [Thermosynechococcaceae cyanobacterium]
MRSPFSVGRYIASVMAIALSLAPFSPHLVSATTVRPTRIPSAAATRTFTCTGIISRYYTRQTVTGTLIRRNVPRNVTVFDYLNNPIQSAATPPLHNAFWGGYWKQNYQLNAWNLGKNTSAKFHFMLPDTPIGGTFQALLVTEFLVGGNWQNWMDCTAA